MEKLRLVEERETENVYLSQTHTVTIKKSDVVVQESSNSVNIR